ncbi:Acetophenone carboxylase gamma subunit [Paraconexibacter sp. AEG42_29]|uniref:Acetophenone carboxylase gamma subunit n=1 Tax=Paraconexibacter sp. AEG42_29 TaxID=2997339 RepID=A0AAU7B238_9ACTN
MPETTIDIDTGGTFTDAFVVHRGEVHTVKVLTTPHDLALCFAQVLERAAEVIGISVDDLLSEAACVRYATTVGTNAVIQRTGPKIGLIVSGDELAVYGEGGPGARLVERFGAPGMVAAVGAASNGTGDAEVVDASKALLGRSARGLVCSIGTAADGAAVERRVLASFRGHYPRQCLDTVPLTLSHDVASDPDDVRRTATALFNAYVHDDVARYLYRAEDWLRENGYTRPLLIVHNDGGCARVAKTVAGRTYNSGPTAGLLGAEEIARVCAIDDLVTFDVGGTSLDVGFLSGGRAPFLEHGRVVDVDVSFAMPDIHVLGSGGGSIAHTLDDGTIEVGPQSAGANPGPACFARGGTAPTVTDADVVLGLIAPDRFLGGRMALDADAATRAMQTLGTDAVAVAASIRARLHDNMAARIGSELQAAGLDPARTSMLAYGGGGPTHACDVAARLGIREVLTVPFAAVFSAFGASSADVRHVYDAAPGDGVDDALRTQALRDMRGEGFGADQVTLSVAAVQRHGVDRTQVTAVAVLSHPQLEPVETTDHTPDPDRTRTVTWPGVGTLETDVHRAAELRPGAQLAGPAVLEADDTTHVVPPGWTYRIDALGIGRLTHTDDGGQ